MPILNCTAKSCIYNQDELCSKGDILVAGENAKISDETCCSSFRERKGDSNSNSEGCGCKSISVDCEACECTFNETKRCSADKITIAGASACESRETKCGSFEQK